MKKIFSTALVASGIALVSPGAALADPTLNDVPPHQHYVVTPDGDLVPFGPDICDDPNLQEAFNQFHNNIHVSGQANKGPVGGAPGFDDEQGSGLLVTGCA